MNPYIDYFVVREKVKEGKTTVGVDPAIARRFYCAPSFASARQSIRESIASDRLYVVLLWGLAHALIVLSFVAAWDAFRWWSVVIVPVTAVWWFIDMGNASIGRPSWWPWVVALYGWIFFAEWMKWSKDVGGWGTCLIIASLVIRLAYRVASSLFRALVLRNRHAFSMFRESAIFIKDTTATSPKSEPESS